MFGRGWEHGRDRKRGSEGGHGSEGAHGPGREWGHGPGRGPFSQFRERFFERGDLKYVILDLLKEKPRHGYEIIRALEERFRGLYTPSPGAVYPTLQMLEDMGHATVQEQDGKRVYTLTDEGRRFLDVQGGSVVDAIRARFGERWGAEARDELRTLTHELKDLGKLFGRQWRGRGLEADQLTRIREVVSRAYREIEAILSEDGSGQSSQTAPNQATPPHDGPNGPTTPHDAPRPAPAVGPSSPAPEAPVTQL